jgi:hypothetical protein
MWRYYLIAGQEVIFKTDSRQEAADKMGSLVWSRGVGTNPVVLVRALYRKQLAVEKRDDI